MQSDELEAFADWESMNELEAQHRRDRRDRVLLALSYFGQSIKDQNAELEQSLEDLNAMIRKL